MQVHDVIHRHVHTCQPSTDLAAATAMMWEHDCGILPVVDDTGHVLGMITDRDIAIAAATHGRAPGEMAVGEVISGAVYSCTQEEDIHAALKTMRQAKVRRLPVVDAAGQLQGILSMNDITLRAEEGHGKQGPELSYHDAMNTLKALCEHRATAEAVHA